MLFNVEKAWEEKQAERVDLEVHLHQNGETLQSIQRHIPKAPEPIESKPNMPAAPPPLSKGTGHESKGRENYG